MKNNYSILSPYFKSIGIISIFLIFSLNSTLGQTPQTEFRLQKMNNLYVGVDNPLDILSLNEFDSISFSNGIVMPNKFSPTRSMSFLLTPEKVDNYGKSQVTIYSKGKTIDEKDYRSLLTPLPKVQITGINDGNILCCVEYVLTAVIPDFDYDVHFEVISFRMEAIIKDEESMILTTSNSNRFTNEQKEILQTLSVGDTIFFENIKINGPGGIRTAEPIKIIIK